MFCFVVGKGEHGKPYPLTEEDHDDSAYRENGFNIFVSNNIALERSLPDIRHPKYVNCFLDYLILSFYLCISLNNLFSRKVKHEPSANKK